MAGRALALIAAGAVLACVAGPLWAVAWRAGGLGGLTGPDLAALRFTLVQAALSAGVSVGLAVPVARALARRRFPGRALVVTALGAPFILPVIVAVLGLLAVFGRAGLLADALGALGLPAPGIYGLRGVVLAHVFLNLPLAVRLILAGWAAVPAERLRLAASLGASSRDVWRLIERPMLHEVVPGALAVVTLVCLTSFAVALTLGGGPRATTLELAVYEAFVLSFDLPRAASLALVQAALGVCVAALGLALALPAVGGDALGRPVERWDAAGAWPRALDGALVAAVLLALALPLGAVVAAGLPRLGALPPSVWAAAGRSLVVAGAAAGLCCALGLAMAVGARGRWPEGVAALGIAVSPLALGTGAFLIVAPRADPAAWALPLTAAVNALMALPFALRALAPAARLAEADHGRLADALGLRGVRRLRVLTLPRLRRPLGFAAGLAAALSVGDLGVVTLFGAQSPTLPLQTYRLMGAYRMEDAAAAALLLMLLALGAFAALDGWGRRARA